MLGTAVDLTTSVTGVFTKPISEYRQDRDGRAYEDASAEVSRNAEHASNSTSKSENATSVICPPSAGSDCKGISAGRMTGSSAMSLVGFVPKALKGMTVDIPLALTEGLRACLDTMVTPQLLLRYYLGGTSTPGLVGAQLVKRDGISLVTV